MMEKSKEGKKKILRGMFLLYSVWPEYFHFCRLFVPRAGAPEKKLNQSRKSKCGNFLQASEKTLSRPKEQYAVGVHKRR